MNPVPPDSGVENLFSDRIPVILCGRTERTTQAILSQKQNASTPSERSDPLDMPTSPPDPHAVRRDALVDSFTTSPGARVRDPRVIEAMRTTPRHCFVPEEMRAQAYRDEPLAIGYGQTISQPSLVAFMTQELQPRPEDRVLEVGTGSGYQAAVLSPLVAAVHTIEIVEALARRAAETFAALGYENVFSRFGNGYEGWSEEAPFDAILVTCAPDAIPAALVDQLREGGRMVIPVGAENEIQELYALRKKDGNVERRGILPVRFVPMTGADRTGEEAP